MLSLVGNALHFWAALAGLAERRAGGANASWLAFLPSEAENWEAAEPPAALPCLPELPPPAGGLRPQLVLPKRSRECAGDLLFIFSLGSRHQPTVALLVLAARAASFPRHCSWQI